MTFFKIFDILMNLTEQVGGGERRGEERRGVSKVDVSSLMLIAPTSTFNRQNQTATTSCAVCLVLGDGAMELFVVWVYIAGPAL